ncbi:F-box only protein 25 [Araneus ventricosus]|uniref:F-box only protein 25 n=1 Tax=Araneus ventricosus TaxID=182803 RepID=A0A4Y2GBS8_ARAVE|nr:F-box only protein 25 [Araneus ventricosus]
MQPGMEDSIDCICVREKAFMVEGKDWRSPGEAWVKTSEGWERKKILEYKSNHGQQRYSRNKNAFHEKKRDTNSSEYQFGSSNIGFINNSVMNECQPHCQITLKNTKEPIDDGKYRLTDMPAAILREILLRLSDYKDLMNSAQACDDMKFLVDEQHIWRQLCKFHFSKDQIDVFFETNKIESANSKVDWHVVFRQLRRKHGLKEEYTESLFLCRHCRCLFWKSFGHPCVDLRRSIPSGMECMDENNGSLANTSPLYIPVPPQAFLSFFSL